MERGTSTQESKSTVYCPYFDRPEYVCSTIAIAELGYTGCNICDGARCGSYNINLLDLLPMEKTQRFRAETVGRAVMHNRSY
jgi:hypothetical protein